MIESTLQQSQPTKAPETFPALYQHNSDGGVWLFTNRSTATVLSRAICVLPSPNAAAGDTVGMCLDLYMDDFVRLTPDQQVVLQNSD